MEHIAAAEQVTRAGLQNQKQLRNGSGTPHLTGRCPQPSPRKVLLAFLTRPGTRIIKRVANHTRRYTPAGR